MLLKLPIELKFLIFENVELRNLTKLRLVCKEFRLLIDKIYFKELVIDNFESSNYVYDKWFHTNENIDKNKKIHKINLNKLNLTTFNFTKIKRLRIDGILKDFELDFCKLLNNLFGSIEQFELHEISINHSKTLILPNLKILAIDYIRSLKANTIFKIDSNNNLKILRIDDCCIRTIFKVKNPKTIQHLFLNYNDKNLSDYSSTQIFSTFTLEPITLNNDILIKLPNLKQINLNMFNCGFKYSEIKFTINNLLDRKRELKKSNLKIYYLNYLLENDKKFEHHRF